MLIKIWVVSIEYRVFFWIWFYTYWCWTI